VWREKGVLPDALFSMTCRQFIALFGKRPDPRLDKVAELQAHNDARGKRGLRPTIPGGL
jgi:hypothetical protein